MSLTIKPIDVYSAYPGSEFTNVPAPVENDTFEYYANIVGHNDLLNCGDTLFAFLFFELQHAQSDEDVLRLVHTAINDLQAIERACQRKINQQNGG